MYRDTVFTILSYLICVTILYLLVVSSRVCSAVARVLLCVSCLCWCSRQTRCFPKFSLEIHCRKVSNAEASQLECIPCHEWSSVLLRSACLWYCGPGCLVLLTRLATWNSRVADQVGNLERSRCRPGGTW